MAWTKTYDGDEPQRINKWMAQNGVCSRREAEALIGQGLVRVDGKPVNDPGHKILPGQTLVLAGAGQSQLDAQFSIVLNKPVGVVSAQPEGRQIPAARLIRRDTLWGKAERIPDAKTLLAPAGRLDQDSRGLLILSEDGVLVKAIIGPQSDLDKEYLVRVAGEINPRKLALLRHGLSLDGRQLKPAKVDARGQQLRFILREGRNRQIRRMCEAVDLEVVDLFRTRIGALRLGDLPEGKWRPLTPEERASLLKP